MDFDAYFFSFPSALMIMVFVGFDLFSRWHCAQ